MFLILLLCMSLGSGHAKVKFQPRIVGGEEISISKAPYQVALSMDGGGFCGGVIISRRTILTAAHCFSTRTVTFVNVRAGARTLDGSEGVLIQGKSIIYHPKYSMTNHNYDLALLILNQDLTFGPTIQPIALSSDRLCANTTVQASGWGALNEGGGVTGILRSVDLQIAPASLCQKTYGSYLGEAMFCVGSMTDVKGTCGGDSGGPVVMNGKLIGITSQGVGCGRVGVPGIYAHVPLARDWIIQNTQ